MESTPASTPIHSQDRPHYIEVKRETAGAYNKHGKPVWCQGCKNKGREGAEIAQATWIGVRRPVARIMTYPFAYCDECWREERMR